ncbi:hypothetical protein [Arthrobacter sp. KBS0703]|uniref:hypothetical protein n=1 Tax=Arthrobacter sp. KBS0703 TaxID=1955698 RepID=UPI00163DC6E5|nr:hypothetical protein [Arthrobacter sp. KBS0703]
MWNSADEAYRAGFRAGHVQGWRDALASSAAKPAAARPTRSSQQQPTVCLLYTSRCV